MNLNDPFFELKNNQKERWSTFFILENVTIHPADFLAKFAKVHSNQKVLDVACGTGIVALTASRTGAEVSGIDLSPTLVERAIENAKIAQASVNFCVGDVEYLPYENDYFDVVLSQFGHMFAPRSQVAIKEMLRVLKPNGVLAFSTWPPEMFSGQSFKLFARYMPPPPEGILPATLWGEPEIISERLGDQVKDIMFDRRINRTSYLSVKHARTLFEKTLPTFFRKLSTTDPKKYNEFITEYENLFSSYMQGNTLEQHFLMTRARKI